MQLVSTRPGNSAQPTQQERSECPVPQSRLDACVGRPCVLSPSRRAATATRPEVKRKYPVPHACPEPRVLCTRRAGTARRRRGCCAARAARRCGCGWRGARGASRGCPRGPSRGRRRGRWSTRSCRCGGRGCSSAHSSTRRCPRRSCRRVREPSVKAQGNELALSRSMPDPTLAPCGLRRPLWRGYHPVVRSALARRPSY